jgi:Amidohydrolase
MEANPDMARHSGRIDVHQHLWPAPLVEELRRRTRAPMLRGWTLHTASEAPFDVDAADHDPAARAQLDPATDAALVSLSAPLGIEALDPDDAQPLLQAWHDGARELPAPFRAWASVTDREPDLAGLKDLLADFVGLQLPATALATPAAVERMAPVLELCAQADRPVLLHPGPVTADDGAVPSWWPAVVDYPAQLNRAWWAWHVAGRAVAPQLRLCFVAGAGLAPLQHERFTARGGGRFVVDHDVFVDTSSLGRQGIDALTRALGVDVVVLGSDRPYALPADTGTGRTFDILGDAARHAVCFTNPTRLLQGGSA